MMIHSETYLPGRQNAECWALNPENINQWKEPKDKKNIEISLIKSIYSNE